MIEIIEINTRQALIISEPTHAPISSLDPRHHQQSPDTSTHSLTVLLSCQLAGNNHNLLPTTAPVATGWVTTQFRSRHKYKRIYLLQKPLSDPLCLLRVMVKLIYSAREGASDDQALAGKPQLYSERNGKVFNEGLKGISLNFWFVMWKIKLFFTEKLSTKIKFDVKGQSD